MDHPEGATALKHMTAQVTMTYFQRLWENVVKFLIKLMAHKT